MTYRSLFFFLGFVLILASCEQAPESNAPETTEETTALDPQAAKAAAQQLIKDAFDAVWSDLDTTSLARLHTDDFLLLEQGEVWTNDSIINYQRNALPGMLEQGYKRENRFEFLETKVTPASVWVAYHNYAVWMVGEEETGRAHWLESAVAIPTSDGWKLQMLHSTRVRD